MLSPCYMSIKAKLTAVAIATASTVLSYSVPSQASEYGYFYELEKMAIKQGVKHYLDELSVSEKLQSGKKYCEELEYKSIKDIYSVLEGLAQDAFQEGYSEGQVNNFMLLEVSIFYASVKELCPEYKYKFNNFMSEYSE